MKIYVHEQITKMNLCYMIDTSGIDRALGCIFIPMPIASGIHRKVIFTEEGPYSSYSLLSHMFRHVGYQKSLTFRYKGKS